VEYGAAGIWTNPEPPIVINPLGVVESAGKQRMIVNGRVVNAFLKALPFRYEKLWDILAFTEQGSFMATWDLKSGYFHVPIHPAFQKYFAFKVNGITFYFKVLCFGFAQACFVFTKVMQEPAFELRKRGIPMSDYIDDAFTAARTIHRCARQSALSALFFGALGAFLGLPKCHLYPEQMVGWLGFLVDSLEQRFMIGESKVAKIKAVLLDTIKDPTTTPRKLAKLAGKLVSISPAVLPAALFSRTLFEAMQGKVSWDSIFPTADSVRDTAQFWLNNLDRLNGRRWWPRKVGLQVSVDASNLGYGGIYSVDSGPESQFTGTFSDREAAASSMEREVRGYVAALRIASQQFRDQLTQSSLLLTRDNQGAISALNKLRSPVAGINDLLKEVFDLCTECNCDLVARWTPRENLSEKDDLSRRPDPSDWGISPQVFQEVIEFFGVQPTVDIFASHSHHVAEIFVSQCYSPGCTAVDAHRIQWDRLVGSQIAWVFPPVQNASLALSLLAEYRVSALVCIPFQAGSNELIQLKALKARVISRPFMVPKLASSCIPSKRVPQNSLNPAFLNLAVLYVQW
jgi:hypothetical protein